MTDVRSPPRCEEPRREQACRVHTRDARSTQQLTRVRTLPAALTGGVLRVLAETTSSLSKSTLTSQQRQIACERRVDGPGSRATVL